MNSWIFVLIFGLGIGTGMVIQHNIQIDILDQEIADMVLIAHNRAISAMMEKKETVCWGGYVMVKRLKYMHEFDLDKNGDWETCDERKKSAEDDGIR